MRRLICWLLGHTPGDALLPGLLNTNRWAVCSRCHELVKVA